jgi:hypothetical protein
MKSQSASRAAAMGVVLDMIDKTDDSKAFCFHARLEATQNFQGFA